MDRESSKKGEKPGLQWSPAGGLGTKSPYAEAKRQIYVQNCNVFLYKI